MFNHFVKQFPQLQKQLDKYAAYYHRIEVPAKTILLREGEISRRAFIIEQGSLRAWFTNKGKDITFQFFFEKEGVSSIESFRRVKPSLYSIETVEPCVVKYIHKKDADMIMKDLENIPEIREQLNDILLDRQLNYMSHFMSLIRDTPKERYLNLIKEKPQIIKRIPQHYIASYLGITAVSLSRIRNAILK
ncbi:Crp/Fnr family transcriptional regulator [Pedobacter sp. PAMC26386]|nr:Crp/Fnr family transcriptional regulator [Pedobacter sp. PAMC26386]